MGQEKTSSVSHLRMQFLNMSKLMDDMALLKDLDLFRRNRVIPWHSPSPCPHPLPSSGKQKSRRRKKEDAARDLVLELAYLALISPISRSKLRWCLHAFIMTFESLGQKKESLGPPVVLPDPFVDDRQYFLLDPESTEDSKGSFQTLTN